MDYQLFSADDHLDSGGPRLDYLPADLWTERVAAAYTSRAPHVEDTPQGRQWVVDGQLHGPPLTETRPIVGKDAVVLENERGQWRPTVAELRLEDMDRDGVEGHVLYGAPGGLFEGSDSELTEVIVAAYNKWLADFSSVSPGRLIGIGVLPTHSAESATRELQHCAELGLKGVQFRAYAAYRYPWDLVWEPLWAAAAETGLSISFHIGGDTTWSTGQAFKAPQGSGSMATRTATVPSRVDEVLCTLIHAGILKRHPKFKAVLAESGIGWIPYMLERVDRKYEERHASNRDDAVDLDMQPSDYYRRQMFATFQEDPFGIQLIDYLGRHTVMWASDYPHADSVWPRSHETVEAAFKGVDPKITRMAVRENALGLYG